MSEEEEEEELPEQDDEEGDPEASWNEAGLRPLTTCPLNLFIMRPKEAADAIVRWFFDNFENPARQTSYAGRAGGYVSIWGPYDAREIVERVFQGRAPADVIHFAVDEIGGEGTGWVPASSRVLPPAGPAPIIRSAGELHSEMQAQVGELQELLAKVEDAHGRMGHNRSPEPLDEVPLTKADTVELASALTTLAAQPVEPADKGAAATEATATIGAKRTKLGKWLTRMRDVAIAGALTEAAKTLFHELWPKIEQVLSSLLKTAGEWLASAF